MIRPADLRDAENLAQLWNPWIKDSAVTFNPRVKTAEDIAEIIQSRQALGHVFLVAEEASQLLGFATYAQFRGGEGYARSMEHTIILHAHARGKGIGRRLMTAIEDHARAAGHRLMIGAVSGENPKGRAFHEAMGYQIYGIIPDAGWKFGRYMDLWLLGKRL